MTVTGSVETGGLVKIDCDGAPIHTHHYARVECVKRPYGGQIRAWEVPGLAPAVFLVDVMNDRRD